MATAINLLTDEWLDIETAPSNGTVVDLWDRYDGRLTDCKFNKNNNWVYWGINDYGNLDFVVVKNATHWRPLPTPPLFQ